MICFATLLLLLSWAPQPTRSVGLVTTLLTRSVSVITPSTLTVGVTTTIRLTGLHLSSSDRIGLSSSTSCALPFLTTTTPSVDLSTTTGSLARPVVDLLVLPATVQTLTTSYLCLQVDGTINDETPFINTGATMVIAPNSTINSIGVLLAEPSNWPVAPLSAVVVTVGVQGYGLIQNMSATLSSTTRCGASSEITSMSYLNNVTKDSTFGTFEFTVSAAALKNTILVNQNDFSTNLAYNLTRMEWKNNLITSNSSGWTFCYDPLNEVQSHSSVSHALPPLSATPSITVDGIWSSSRSGMVAETVLNVRAMTSSTSTTLLMSIKYSDVLVGGDLINVYLPKFGGVAFSSTSGVTVDGLSSGSLVDSSVAWNAVTQYLTVTLGSATKIPKQTFFNITIAPPLPGTIQTPPIWPPSTFDVDYKPPQVSIFAASASTHQSQTVAIDSIDVTMNLYNQEKYASKASFAQVVATTSEEYIIQETFNSTNYQCTLPPKDGFMPIVKLPPRYGHTTSTMTRSFMGRSIRQDMYVFGGRYNGVRKHLWIYRPGVYNTTEEVDGSVSSITGNVDESILALRDATGDDLKNDAKICSGSKQSSLVPHVCNTWQPANATIMRKKCTEIIKIQSLLVVQGVYCAGLELTSSTSSSSSSTSVINPTPNSIVLQKCSSNYTQRMYFKEDDHTVRIGATLDKYGYRSGGWCLEAADDGSPTIHVKQCPSKNQPRNAMQSIKIDKSKINSNLSQLKFTNTSQCIGIISDIKADLPRLSRLSDHLLGRAFIQFDCGASEKNQEHLNYPLTAEQYEVYNTFTITNATNECDDVAVDYDITTKTGSGINYDGLHLGRYDHGAAVLVPGGGGGGGGGSSSGSSSGGGGGGEDGGGDGDDDHESLTYESSEFGKLMVFGGKDMEVGALSDVWSYSVNTRQWLQLHDGGSWRDARDVHLHSQKDIQMSDSEKSFQGTVSPSPRTKHTNIPVYTSKVASITKTINVKESSFLDGPIIYRQVRFKVRKGFNLVFPDNDDSSAPIARTRDYEIWIYANTDKGWNGTFYPFSFTYEKADSLIYGYDVTLLSPQQIQINRPHEYSNSSSTKTSDDKFVNTVVSGTSDYFEEYVYTCNAHDQAKVLARIANPTSSTSCGDNPSWADNDEFYNITETKTNLVTSTSTTGGKASFLVFGGWKVENSAGLGDDGGYPTNELWMFSYSAQLDTDDIYKYEPNIHDSPYSTFPCCGTVQNCCGSDDGDFFPTCKKRRENLVAEGKCDDDLCCGTMPVINTWQQLPLSGYEDGVPTARYGHTSNEIGTPSRLQVKNKNALSYRMIVFGGLGDGRMLNDLWELSLEEQQTNDYMGTYHLKCAANAGHFRFQMTTTGGSGGVNTVYSHYIHTNFTLRALRESIEIMNGVSVEKLHVTYQHPDNANSQCICGTANNDPSTATVVALQVRLLSSMRTEDARKTTKTTASQDDQQQQQQQQHGDHRNTMIEVEKSTIELAFHTQSGYVGLKKVSSLARVPSNYVWSKPDRNIKIHQRPSRRAHHSSTIMHDHSQNDLERLVVFGGWNGNTVLNDVWVYSPSVQWGREGKWLNIVANDGKFLEVRPNLIKSLIAFFGYNENFKAKAKMPSRYLHTAVAISTGFTTDENGNLGLPRESLMVYGGVGTHEVAKGGM